jgi:hypothetical protein
VVLVADLAVVLLRPSSSFLLFRRCFFFFVSFAPSVNNVLLSLQRLRGDAGGGGLGSVLDGGRPFFLFSFAFFFSSVRLCFRFFLLLLTGLLSTGRAMTAGGDAGGCGEESDDASR